MPRRATAAAAVALLVSLAGATCASAQEVNVQEIKPAPEPTALKSTALKSTALKSTALKSTALKSTALKSTVPVTLDGAGANSIDPFFEAVFYAYHKAHSQVTINYDPAGSSVGVTDVEQRTVDFGDSEIPMAAKDLAKAKGTVLQVPVDLGGVAISYNIPGVRGGLKLSAAVLAGIFDGAITNWDAPAIAKVAGDTKLPDLRIVPVHRADSSGPSWDVDDYLIGTSPAWRSAAHASKPSKAWPLTSTGVGEQLNGGVATYIAQTAGAIGYVEYGYALKARFTDAAVQDRAGDFVAPGLASIAAAGRSASGLSATNFSIIDKPGAGTYPMANFSWTLLYQKQADLAKGEALQALFNYVVTTGQGEAPSLGYAPLPANAVTLARSTLDKLETSSGKPLQ
jgi:phosphate transport system substrate-binding protein